MFCRVQPLSLETLVLKNRNCGDLRSDDAGKDVTLAGWVHNRRDQGGLIFIDLRDATGLVQVKFDRSTDPEAHAVASQCRPEYVLQLRGVVLAREERWVNPKLATGAVEVEAREARVLNAAKTPPFYINQDAEVSESLRLKYRYLDLRRERMHENILLRGRVVKLIRDFMDARGFTEIETPVMIKATPEGARDYLVPSRVYPGQFYALPQSPQQLKQLLMVAGFERYFQIARCFRDEDLRADRQPEFTQLDFELSFVEEEDIYELLESLMLQITRELAPRFKVPAPFPRMTYAEAMRRFGSDKPDLRYGLELFDAGDLFQHTEFGVFRAALGEGGTIRGVVAPGGAQLSRRQTDEYVELVRTRGAKGLVPVALLGEGSVETLTLADVRSTASRFVSIEEFRALAARAGAQRGDMIMLVADREPVVNAALDLVRRTLAQQLELADPETLAFGFVTEFPMFEWNAGEERWDSTHHLFTAPVEEDVPLLETDPGAARSRAYDLICNGWELGSGSIRIHDRALQSRIFDLLRITPEEQQLRFGHMLEAFEYGAPPHGGMAPGIDRIVALLCGETDIREVIAFPKTKSASDLMLGAPSPVDARQLHELSLSIDPV
jgi:aspartyl-tRNA synthetase